MKALAIFALIIGIIMLFIHPMLTLLAGLIAAIIWHGHVTRRS